MTNYNQLNSEQRDIIQLLINTNHNFSYIAKSIKVDRTTISKEIRRNRYIKSNFYEPFDKKGINEAINKCNKLSYPPYICNTCPNKNNCSKHKLYYNSKEAQKHYEKLLVSSREGVDIKPETIEEIENAIVPLIKNKKQSINQVYTNHNDILYMSKPTFYKYVNLGVLSLKNIDLPKKVKYKKRKKKQEYDYKRKLALLKGRSFEEFIAFKTEHIKMHICQMDTVIGTLTSSKVLLTIIFMDTHFMLIRLLNKNNVKCVNNEFDIFKKKLGIKNYAKIFRIILTDNGTEFFDPLHIELDYETGKKIANVFYCHPHAWWEKGTIENNHKYIRDVFPQGTNFDNFTNEQIQKLEDNINNIPRDSLKGKTPHELTKEKYPELIEKLNCKYIKPDDVTLNKKDIIGDGKDE